MKVYRIDISTWTSSFKYPNLISGGQPTLDVPPLSTILGMINAAAGKYVVHERLKIGYYFTFQAKQVDLESIYQIEGNEKGVPQKNVKSNVINREFLFDNRLFVYLTDSILVDYFRKPYYPLLLGRSGDLATVDKIVELDLEEVQQADKVKGQIVPLLGNYVSGVIQPLPKYFTNTIPRRNIGTEPYSVVSWDTFDESTGLTAYADTPIDNKEVHIYFHDLDFSDRND